MKKCNKCGEFKELTEFNKKKDNKDGHMNICSVCRNKKRREDYTDEETKDKISKQNKKYRLANKVKIEKKRKEDYHKDIEGNRRKSLEYYHENKKPVIKKKCMTQEERFNKWKLENIEHYLEYQRNYQKQNKEKRNERERERMKIDPLYKLKENIRTNIIGSFKRKGFTKSTRTEDILQLTIPEFKKYIEDQFEPWMNWENHGKYEGEFNQSWDLDHIIPVSSATTEEEVIKLNHYTNFQPLCSKINREIKRDLII